MNLWDISTWYTEKSSTIFNELTLHERYNLPGTYPAWAVQSFSNLPCMRGTIFHAPNPPVPMNCPTNTSMANAGIPIRNTVMKYGTKNAPGIETFRL